MRCEQLIEKVVTTKGELPQVVHVPCGAEVNNWRACPQRGCDKNIVFCQKHGGDDRATLEMQRHIAEHKPRA
jgi:hypothetical protein